MHEGTYPAKMMLFKRSIRASRRLLAVSPKYSAVRSFRCCDSSPWHDPYLNDFMACCTSSLVQISGSQAPLEAMVGHCLQTTEKSSSIYSPSILTPKDQSIFSTLLFSPEWEDIFSLLTFRRGWWRAFNLCSVTGWDFSFFLKTGFQGQEAKIWK